MLNKAWGEKKCMCEVNSDTFPRTIENMLRGHQAFWGLRVGTGAKASEVIGIDNYTGTAPAYESSGSITHSSSKYETAFDSAHSQLGAIKAGSSVTIYRTPWNKDLDLHSWIDHTADGELSVRITNLSGSTISLAAGSWYITVITYGD